MIYLDSAATTFQKPDSVYQAVNEAMRTLGSPGRGGYRAAHKAEETAYRCRTLAASFFHVSSPEQVVFTANATHALNIAIKSLIPPGGKVVISGYEHNAVTRPLYALRAKVEIATSPLFAPEQILRSFAERISYDTDAVICTHVSNVFGYILPIDKIAALCNTKKIPLIIDASQSAGILPIDFSSLGAAFLAMPGHKGLYGPQGTGILLCSSDAKPLFEGGTGSESLIQDMPDFLPDRLEAGTHNMPGIAGLEAGLRFVSKRHGMIQQHERRLIFNAVKKLQCIPGIKLYASPQMQGQLGVLSFSVSDCSPENVAAYLAERRIAVRAGLHCSPLAHNTAETLPKGTVRISTSAFSTRYDVDMLASVLGRMQHK